MAKFTQIPTKTFQELQINAGIICTDFTPATGVIGESGRRSPRGERGLKCLCRRFGDIAEGVAPLAGSVD